MKWSTFSLSQMPDQSQRVAAFDGDMRQFELAEELGYDTIWLAEHLFSTYGVCTSTQVLAAAVAQRTTRIKIGTAVVVIPFNHPLRTASDFALVDVLSHGRLLFGAGRAYQPHEFVGLGVPMEQSREMYAEGLDLVIRAWTEETVTHKGKFWTVPEPVEVLPKPVQTPHPPIYQACISPDSFASAAESGCNLQLASPFTYRTYRESWIDKLEESLQDYERACERHGRDPKAAERMLLLPFFVAETSEEAQSVFANHVEWFYNKVTNNQASVKGLPEDVKGYELTMRESRRTLAEGYLNFSSLYKYGAAIADDPQTCAEKLCMLRDRLGITEFALWMNIGGISGKHAEGAMRLAAQEVFPLVDPPSAQPMATPS